MLLDRIQNHIATHAPELIPASGGCIHQTLFLSDQGNHIAFIKTAPLAEAPMLKAEAFALEKIAACNCIRVPRLINFDDSAEPAFLALEALNLYPLSNTRAWQLFGTNLRQLHENHHTHFGWEQDNFIGRTTQANPWLPSWSDFFTNHRLKPQFTLASHHGHTFAHTDNILNAVTKLLASHSHPPSLLHGDLWSGNVAMLPNDEPVIFDPASYYGDPMADLAMLELFGPPLPSSFWQGYGRPPYIQQALRPIYNLYHYLNHLNLFDSSYLPAVNHCISKILKTCP